MTYGLTNAEINLVSQNDLEADGAYEIVYATGTIERITEVQGGLTINGDTYIYDRLLQDSQLGSASFRLSFADRKAAFFDAAGNALGATITAYASIRAADGTRTHLRVFTGLATRIPQGRSGMLVEFTDSRQLPAATPAAWVISAEAQRARDATDTSHEFVSDPRDSEFGRGVA